VDRAEEQWAFRARNSPLPTFTVMPFGPGAR
jgi:hypothetical protein